MRLTYVRPHPEDGMESWLLVAVDRLVARGEVLVFKQLATIWVGQKYNWKHAEKYNIQIQIQRRQNGKQVTKIQVNGEKVQNNFSI